jgi:molybdopterin molybdotransferase
LIDYRDALGKILENVFVLKTENKETYKCNGQILAEDVYSVLNIPQTDIAIPDGYAVKSADISTASRNNPVKLRVLESVRTGYPPQNSVEAGTAIRIMTGSMLPDDCDCVIKFEDTDEDTCKNNTDNSIPSEVSIYVSRKPGEGIRKCGSDINKGKLLLKEGTMIGPNHVSVLATIGRTK